MYNPPLAPEQSETYSNETLRNRSICRAAMTWNLSVVLTSCDLFTSWSKLLKVFQSISDCFI